MVGPDGPADQLYERGETTAAEGAYREALRLDPTRPDGDRALFHLAVLYGTPGSAVFDPEQAESCLERLLAQFPESDYERPARAWLASRRRVEELERELAESRRGASAGEMREKELSSKLADLETRVVAGTQREQAASALAEDQRRRIAELEAALERSTQRAERLERDLQELKRIDLGSPP
ncbi:MAG: hypothetical protein KDD11_12250 [Acidobacteria bacterium]|nr:hypothetical protein [Acidobacteriota bacterium]